MNHLPFLTSRFPMGHGVWRGLCECTRLDLTVILISKGNTSTCSYYMNFILLILPRRYINSLIARGGIFIQCGCIIAHDTN